MSSVTMYDVKDHKTPGQMHQPEEYLPFNNQMICEETACLMPPTTAFEFVLPSNYISIPTNEEGYVSLRQQSVKNLMPDGQASDEQQPSGGKSRHHKAIRRNFSKTKDLVLVVGGLKRNLPTAQYETYATQCTKVGTKSPVGPVFPTLGCFVITFLSGTSCSHALKLFRLTRFCGVLPELTLLPYISMPPCTEDSHYDPLIVFINCKSGGGQGQHLSAMLGQILNPCQVFILDKAGALPGLYAFRKLSRFRVLICGGDGTVGWVLSHFEEVQRHLACTNPPIAVLPLGTGNDLARVLGYGSGWEGGNVTGILSQIHDSHPVKMDRWNIMFDSSVQDKLNSPDPLLLSNAVSFKEDAQFNTGRAVSPVNIVMSIGGTDLNTSVPGKKTGARNLVPLSFPSLRDSPETVRSESELAKEGGDSSDVMTCVINPVSIPTESDMSSNVEADSRSAQDVSSAQPTSKCSDRLPSDFIGKCLLTDEATNNETSDCASTNDNSSGDLMNFDQVVKNSSPKLSRNPKSRNSAKHRMVHILSESDVDFGPFIGVEDSKSEMDEVNSQWRDKNHFLRLTEDIERGNNSETSSVKSGLSDADIQESETLPDEDDEQLDSITDEILPHPLRNNQSATSQPPKYHRFVSESNLKVKKALPCGKKLSLPMSSSIPKIPTPMTPVTPEPSNEVKLMAMTNYFGIGIDAEVNLAFHLAREENPEKCTSRFKNKAIFFKAGLKKMTSRSVNLNNVINLKVDNNSIVLPSIRGLIFLNISSWASGANAWGSGASKRFQPPSFGDGMVEVVGVGGVAHMSQIYSGLRTGIRIAQGTFIRITLKAEVAVQIDGEPWMQPPGEIIISASPLQVTMLKRNKKKSK